MKNLLKPGAFVVITLILMAAFSRLIPHWPNFTAVAAIALFGGATFTKRITAFVVPLAALFVTDLILGFHGTMIPVYLAFSVTVLLGMAIKNRQNVLNIGTVAVSASIIFFLITNFGSWLTTPFYSKDFVGLMQAYAAGLAFFNDGNAGISPFLNMLIGDLFYTTGLFGVFAAVKYRFPALSVA